MAFNVMTLEEQVILPTYIREKASGQEKHAMLTGFYDSTNCLLPG